MIQLNRPESLSAQGRSRDVAPGLPSPKMPQMDPMDTRIEQMTVAWNLSSSSAPGTVGGPLRPCQASF